MNRKSETLICAADDHVGISGKDELPRSLGKFLFFLLKNIFTKRKLWLIPFWILLAIVALILLLTGNGAMLPAIYIAI